MGFCEWPQLKVAYLQVAIIGESFFLLLPTKLHLTYDVFRTIREPLTSGFPVINAFILGDPRLCESLLCYVNNSSVRLSKVDNRVQS